jgi:hypothetical protein
VKKKLQTSILAISGVPKRKYSNSSAALRAETAPGLTTASAGNSVATDPVVQITQFAAGTTASSTRPYPTGASATTAPSARHNSIGSSASTSAAKPSLATDIVVAKARATDIVVAKGRATDIVVAKGRANILVAKGRAAATSSTFVAAAANPNVQVKSRLVQSRVATARSVSKTAPVAVGSAGATQVASVDASTFPSHVTEDIPRKTINVSARNSSLAAARASSIVTSHAPAKSKTLTVASKNASVPTHSSAAAPIRQTKSSVATPDVERSRGREGTVSRATSIRAHAGGAWQNMKTRNQNKQSAPSAERQIHRQR